jgi:hypothetical protein
MPTQWGIHPAKKKENPDCRHYQTTRSFVYPLPSSYLGYGTSCHPIQEDKSEGHVITAVPIGFHPAF